MPTPMAVKLLEAAWADGMGDGVEVLEIALSVEAEMLNDIWVFYKLLMLEDTPRVEVNILFGKGM